MNALLLNDDFSWFCSWTAVFMVFVLLCCGFFQPFDDFEACLYAAVGEFSSLRTEV